MFEHTPVIHGVRHLIYKYKKDRKIAKDAIVHPRPLHILISLLKKNNKPSNKKFTFESKKDSLATKILKKGVKRDASALHNQEIKKKQYNYNPGARHRTFTSHSKGYKEF